jgi:hypothetical protein
MTAGARLLGEQFRDASRRLLGVRDDLDLDVSGAHPSASSRARSIAA